MITCHVGVSHSVTWVMLVNRSDSDNMSCRGKSLCYMSYVSK